MALAQEVNGIVHIAIDIVFHSEVAVRFIVVTPVHDVYIQPFINQFFHQAAVGLQVQYIMPVKHSKRYEHRYSAFGFCIACVVKHLYFIARPYQFFRCGTYFYVSYFVEHFVTPCYLFWRCCKLLCNVGCIEIHQFINFAAKVSIYSYSWGPCLLKYLKLSIFSTLYTHIWAVFSRICWNDIT